MNPRNPIGIGTALDALQRAGSLFRAGRYLEAAAVYRDIIRRRPRLPDVHNNLGVALKAAGHLADAVPCFRRAVRLKPDYVAAHVNLAAALEAIGKPLEGLEHRLGHRARGAGAGQLARSLEALHQHRDGNLRRLSGWAGEGDHPAQRAGRVGAPFT